MTFHDEVGRTCGVLQCDPEPALRLAETVTSELGGLTIRASPTGWKQALKAPSGMRRPLCTLAIVLSGLG